MGILYTNDLPFLEYKIGSSESMNLTAITLSFSNHTVIIKISKTDQDLEIQRLLATTLNGCGQDKSFNNYIHTLIKQFVIYYKDDVVSIMIDSVNIQPDQLIDNMSCSL